MDEHFKGSDYRLIVEYLNFAMCDTLGHIECQYLIEPNWWSFLGIFAFAS